MIKSGDNIIIEMLKQPNIKQISGHLKVLNIFCKATHGHYITSMITLLTHLTYWTVSLKFKSLFSTSKKICCLACSALDWRRTYEIQENQRYFILNTCKIKKKAYKNNHEYQHLLNPKLKSTMINDKNRKEQKWHLLLF